MIEESAKVSERTTLEPKREHVLDTVAEILVMEPEADQNILDVEGGNGIRITLCGILSTSRYLAHRFGE